MVSIATAHNHDRWLPFNSESKPLYSSKHASAALRWLESMRENEEWALSVDEQCELLGGIPRRTLQSWKKKALAGEDIDLSRDVMERLSLLLGIYKAYKILAPSNRPDVATDWFKQPNQHELYQGRSVKEYLLLMGTMNAMYTVRRYLDASRG